jgi:hypothetical protein
MFVRVDRDVLTLAGFFLRSYWEAALNELVEDVFGLRCGPNSVVGQPRSLGNFLRGQAVAKVMRQADAPEEQSLQHPLCLLSFLRADIQFR